jgi:uncharacterized integral membrane protein (TIGR00698 family)
MFSSQNRDNTLNGILFVALFAIAAKQLASFGIFAQLGLSPLIIGIMLGMLYGNTLHSKLPVEWHEGINFSARRILRLAIILYGFSITIQEVMSIGWQGMTIAVTVVTTILSVGFFVGTRVLKMDNQTALLTAAGSAICGAAAILAIEPVIKAKGHHTAVAVATVVIFGTLAMFVYPLLVELHIFNLSPFGTGLFFGGTIHEVAQVVGATGGLGNTVAQYAVIEKMTRVLLIVPVILIIGYIVVRNEPLSTGQTSPSFVKTVPWFAVGFLAVGLFNSLHLLPKSWVDVIREIDTFLLTMAMVGLGMQTQFSKMKAVGPKAFILATILFIILISGGYLLTYLLVG